MNLLSHRLTLVIMAAISLFLATGCNHREKSGALPDPKWEEAHFKAQEVVELINVRRQATDRSYYYPRDVADLDSDGNYEVIVGWHPQGGPDGTDLLWRVIGDTMVMSPDSALLWHDGVQMHLDSNSLNVKYPLWLPTDSTCCPSKEVHEKYRVSGDRVVVLSQDTLSKTTSQ